MYINRIHNPIDLIQKKSYFLFGARSIGKSALIHKLLPENYAYINLVSTDVFLRLAAEPSLLEPMIMTKKFVVIDEIQKLPILLDEVHRLIEEREIHFLLTGSSARSLKRKSANLLGGRAQQTFLFPLTYAEIKNFDLEKHLLYGGIPRVHLAVDPELELDSYLQVYLEQEIQIEANLRSLPLFSRFLKVAAISNAQLINYSSIASDCGVSENTVKEYYQILVDTLI
ncbi:MAG: AAA family ATPase, partial [Bdellovibrionales bacterium]